MSGTLADGHRVDILAELVIDAHEALQHLLFSNEGLDDTQTAQRLVELSQDVAPLTLHLGRLTLQLTADRTHNPACQGGYDNDKHGELPADGEHGGEADDDGYRLADKHVDTAGNTVLYRSHVGRHTGNDVALALVREETQRQAQHLVVDLDTDIANDARPQGNHHR